MYKMFPAFGRLWQSAEDKDLEALFQIYLICCLKFKYKFQILHAITNVFLGNNCPIPRADEIVL